MTFRLDAFVAKIQSYIIFVADGVESSFESGKDLAIYDFSKRYTVKSLYTNDGKIVIEAKEMKVNLPFNYAGETALLIVGNRVILGTTGKISDFSRVCGY